MELSFFGVQKEGTDSFSFFQKLEELGLDYDVDLKTGRINISKIQIGTRDQVVKIVSETFDITNIKSITETKTESKAEVKTECETESETIICYETYYIKKALKRLEDILNVKRFPQKELNMYVKKVCRELELVDSKISPRNIVPGDIVECEFGLERIGENCGKGHALVLRKAPENTYWVLPINLNPTELHVDGILYMLIKKDEDATYYNNTYKSENAILYLDRLWEVSSVRIMGRFGMVTDKFLMDVRKRIASLIVNDAGINTSKDKSLKDILEERIRPALKKSTEGNQILNMETFLKEMKIPADSVCLAKTFEIAYAHKERTLAEVYHRLVIDQKLEGKERLRMQKMLRNEFVEWMRSEYYDIYITHKNISLGNVLKAFINSLEKM